MTTNPQPQDAPLAPRARRIAMTALMGASILASVDTTIANTALPQIAQSLSTTDATVIWVANAYQIAVIATMLPFASLGESLGYKKVYAAGITLFGLASALCGGASALWMLILARALQGVGAAAMLSVVAAVIRQIYPAKMLGRGLATNALVVAVGFTLGPVLASAVLAVAEWNWLFFINVPIAVVAVVLAMIYLPEDQVGRHRFELAPAVLCTGLLGFVTVAFCLVENGDGGSWALAFAAIALVCLVSLLRIQRNHSAPMLAVDLLRNRTIRLSSLTSICAFTTQSLALISLPFFFQGSHGITVVQTGLMLAAWPLLVAVMAMVAAPIGDSGRYPPGTICSAGLLLLAGGMVSLALLPSHPSALNIALRLAICGVGFGLFQTLNMREIMSKAPVHRSGGASGLIAVSRLMGQTIGAALVAQCFHAYRTDGPMAALLLGSGAAFLGCIFSAMRLKADNAKLAFNDNAS